MRRITQKMKKKTVYIAGKVSGEDFTKCFEKFKEKERSLKLYNFNVINPMKVERKISIEKMGEKTQWGDVMLILLEKIKEEADQVYVLRDYRDSIGALIEINFAEKCGKEIVYEEDE